MIQKILAICLMSLTSIHSLSGQSAFSMENYLKTALDDQTLERFQAQLNFLNKRRYKKPLISEVELRMGSDNAHLSLNDYRLRISSSNPAEGRANKLFYQKQLNSVNAAYRVALNEALKNRYLLLIDHYYFNSHHNIISSWQTDAARLIRLIADGDAGTVHFGDVIDLESDMSDALTKMNELGMYMDEIEYLVELDLPDLQGIQWAERDMISVEAIRKFVENEREGALEDNIYVKEAREELTLEEQLYKLNKAESWSDIGFIEGQYDSERGDGPREHIGFRVGVVLPIFNQDKADLDRDRFDLLEEAAKVSETRELVARQQRRLLIKLENLFKRRDLLRERMANARQIKPVIPVDKPVDVLHLLDHKTYLTELEEMDLKTRRDIYEAFIEFLDFSGRLVGEPLINYLSPEFKTIN